MRLLQLFAIRSSIRFYDDFGKRRLWKNGMNYSVESTTFLIIFCAEPCALSSFFFIQEGKFKDSTADQAINFSQICRRVIEKFMHKIQFQLLYIKMDYHFFFSKEDSIWKALTAWYFPQNEINSSKSVQIRKLDIVCYLMCLHALKC